MLSQRATAIEHYLDLSLMESTRRLRDLDVSAEKRRTESKLLVPRTGPVAEGGDEDRLGWTLEGLCLQDPRVDIEELIRLRAGGNGQGYPAIGRSQWGGLVTKRKDGKRDLLRAISRAAKDD